MFQGKNKAVTFSYDDGVLQDKRLIKLFDKYGLKATFNLNSGFFGKAGALVREGVTVAHCKPNVEEVREIYKGHEVAAHSTHHPALNSLRSSKVVKEVEGDRAALSDIVGYEVRGFAYPGSDKISMSDRTVDLMTRFSGVQYARASTSNYSFEPQRDLMRFAPSVHHTEWDKLFELGKQFIESDADTPQIYYIWGHAYEFDIYDDWDRMEQFCAMISGKDDIFYGTNSDVLLDPDLLEYTGSKLHSFTAKKFLF